MSPELISILRSLTLISMVIIATGICIPKALKFWSLWKGNNNLKHLSMAITYAIAAFYLLSANFVVFIRVFMEGRI